MTLRLALLSLSCLAWPVCEATEPPPSGDTPPRISLRQLQSETEKLAAKANVSRSRTVRHSEAIATDSDDLLKAHILFEKGCQALLSGDKKSALARWQESELLISSLPSHQKEYLRRTRLTQTYEWLASGDQPLPDALPRLESMVSLFDETPLPSTRTVPRNQLLVECEIRSAHTLLLAFRKLAAAPRTSSDQMFLITETIKEIATDRSLVYSLVEAYPESNSHEALLDELVFKPILPDLHKQMRLTLESSAKELPNTLYPAWSSLLAGWECLSAPDSRSTYLKDAPPLSTLDREAQLEFLAGVIRVLAPFAIPGNRMAMAKLVSALSLADLDHPQAALAVADVLLDGGYVEQVNAFLSSPRSTDSANPKFDELKLKALFCERKFQALIDSSNELASKNTPQIHWWRGRAFASLNQHANSIRELQKFLEFSPEATDAPNAALLAGMMALNERQPEQAQTFFRMTVSRYPRSEAAQKAQQFLTAK